MAPSGGPQDVYYFAKDLTLAGGPPQEWRTEWVPWPSHIQSAQFVVVCKSLVSGSASVRLFTSWDMNTEVMAAGISVSALGTTVQDVPGDIGPLVAVRYVLSTASTRMVISAYVIPKST
jgi:hypothetical protein